MESLDEYTEQEEGTDEFVALAEAQAAAFSDESLYELTGTEDLLAVTRLEVVADTSTDDLSPLGLKLPMLQELKLNNSLIPKLRDLGTSFRRLQVLWVSRSGVEDLSGLAGLPILRELYAAFNDVSDLCPVADCEFLQVADFEANKVADFDTVGYLGMVASLTTVSLEGNPIASDRRYRQRVLEAAPQVTVLDDEPVADGERGAAGEDGEPAGGLPSPGVGALLARALVRPHMRPTSSPDDLLAALRKEREAAARELALISDGIKYARCGVDDVGAAEAVADGSDGDGFSFPSSSGRPLRPATPLSRPGSARPASALARPGSSRPGTTSTRPGSALSRPGSAFSRPGSALSRPGTRGSAPPSQAGPRPDLAAALNWSRPSTAASRPSTATSWGWGQGPASAAGSRPGSAMQPHQQGGAGSFRDNPGGLSRVGSRPSSSRMSAASFSGRPGTASSSGGSDSGASAPAEAGLFWRSRRVSVSQAQGAGASTGDLLAAAGADTPRAGAGDTPTKAGARAGAFAGAGAGLAGDPDVSGGGAGGSDDEGENAGSDLTFGIGAVVGNPAQALRARRSITVLARQAAEEAEAIEAELEAEADGPFLDPQVLLRPIAVGAEAEHQELLDELRAWKVGALEAHLIDESEMDLPPVSCSPPRAAAEGGRDVFVVETGEELHEWAAGNGFGFAPPVGAAPPPPPLQQKPPLPEIQGRGMLPPPPLAPLRGLGGAGGGLEALGKPLAAPPPQRAVPAPPSALPPPARRRARFALPGHHAPVLWP